MSASGTGRVQGKVAIITGAASGIGRASAEHLAREGAKVVLTDRNEQEGEKAAAALGSPHYFRPLDVTDEAGWSAVVEEAVEKFGKVDVLVNSAGIGYMADIEHATVKEFRRMYAVNVEGVFLGCRAVFGPMKRAGGGSIINISSVAGLVGDGALVGYCASKGAVRLLSKSVALHGAKGHKIRCNSVHPSFIDTPMVDSMHEAMGGNEKAREHLANASPMRRLGTVDEVAYLIVYLASDESTFTNGAELVVDGGLTAR
jgi:3(or 17)beta-hydroxysteroid dehydrogenase